MNVTMKAYTRRNDIDYMRPGGEKSPPVFQLEITNRCFESVYAAF